MTSLSTPPRAHRWAASSSATPPPAASPSASTALTSSHTYQSFDDLVRSDHTASPRTPTARHVRTWSNRSWGALDGHPPDDDDDDDPAAVKAKGPAADKAWNTLDFVKLTVAIAGAQLAWTVEMACVLFLSLLLSLAPRASADSLPFCRYGTPYLLGLGLTKQGTSLVWMAGPLSGMFVQPIVGESPPLSLCELVASSASSGSARTRAVVLPAPIEMCRRVLVADSTS